MAGTAPLPERSPFHLAQAFVIGGLLVALWMMPQWTWQGDIRITGLRRVQQTAIASHLLAHRGQPLHAMDIGQMRDELRELDGIQEVEIRRWLFPSRLEVVVHERDPRARVTGDLAGYFLDAEGQIFRMDPTWITAPLPMGVRLATASWHPREMKAYRELLERWPAGQVGEVQTTASESWKVHLEGTEVHLGRPGDIPAKWHAYRTVWGLARQEGKQLEYIDVQIPDAPSVRPVRPTPRPDSSTRER